MFVYVHSTNAQKYIYIGKNILNLFLLHLENARFSQISLLLWHITPHKNHATLSFFK